MEEVVEGEEGVLEGVQVGRGGGEGVQKQTIAVERDEGLQVIEEIVEEVWQVLMSAAIAASSTSASTASDTAEKVREGGGTKVVVLQMTVEVWQVVVVGGVMHVRFGTQQL